MEDSVQTYLKKHDIHHNIVDTGDDDEMCIYTVQGNLCTIEIRIGYPRTGERKAIWVLALSPVVVVKRFIKPMTSKYSSTLCLRSGFTSKCLRA